MNRYRSIALALLLLMVALVVLSQLPLIFSIPILLIWPFMPVGEPVIDGYARLFAGLGLALFTGWRIVVLLPGYPGSSGLAQYGQYMMEAQFLAVMVLLTIAIGLVYAGARSLYRASATKEQPE